jgi:ProP effector
MTEKKKTTLKLSLGGSISKEKQAELDSMRDAKKKSEKAAADAKAKEARRERIKTTSMGVLSQLKELFPNCFDDLRSKPLKTGIKEDILERLPEDTELTRSDIQKALKYYTSNKVYHYNVARGDMRYNLDGEKVEAIPEEHKQTSIEWLRAIKKKLDAESGNTNRRPGDNRPFIRKPYNKDADKKKAEVVVARKPRRFT